MKSIDSTVNRIFDKLKQYTAIVENKFIQNREVNNKIMVFLFCIYVITVILDSSVIRAYNAYLLIAKLVRYCIYIVLLGLSFVEFINSEKKEIGINNILLIVLVFLVFFFSRNQSVLIISFMVFAYRHTSFEKISTYSQKVMNAAFCILIVLSIMNIIPDWTFPRDYNRLRHSLGFFYPTTLSTTYLYIMMLDFYSKKKDIKYSDIFAHMLISSLVYFLSDSRTGFIMCNLMILLMLFNKLVDLKRMNVIFKWFFIAFPFVMIACTCIACYGFYYKIPFFVNLNKMLSNRLYFSIEGIKEWGFPLFGKKVKMYGWGGYGYLETPEDFHYNYVDNDYLHMMFNYGILYTLFLCFIYAKTIKKAIEVKNYELLIVLIMDLVLSFIEPNMYKLGKNVFLLTLSEEMYRSGHYVINLKTGLQKKEVI